jgi:hypothetical protein
MSFSIIFEKEISNDIGVSVMLVIRELRIAFILIRGVQINDKVNGTKRNDFAFLSEH